MTDRKLLELASKAVGMDCVWEGNLFQYKPRFETVWITWNPLTDDGDALRLAVKLGMSLVIGSHGFKGKTSWARCGMLSREDHHNDDPYAATRRAIVRAAAEIGKGMA